MLRDKKIEELAYQDVLSRVKGFGDNLAVLPAVLLAELRDPLGFASIFIPGAASRKFVTGFLSGSAASAIVLTPAAIRDTEFQGTFQSQQLVLSILAGGTLSGLIGKGLGTLDKFSEIYKRRREATFGKVTETPTADELQGFKGSKVVDDTGDLIEVYHGTDKAFDEFDVESAHTVV